jgi:hypothetical protein
MSELTIGDVVEVTGLMRPYKGDIMGNRPDGYIDTLYMPYRKTGEVIAVPRSKAHTAVKLTLNEGDLMYQLVHKESSIMPSIDDFKRMAKTFRKELNAGGMQWPYNSDIIYFAKQYSDEHIAKLKFLTKPRLLPTSEAALWKLHQFVI